MGEKTKLERLLEFAAKDAKNPFPRYAVAMELAGLGRLEEASLAFAELARDFPDYVPAYFHAGRTLERLGRAAEARAAYEKGVEVATLAGNRHARDELEEALALLLDSGGS